MALTNYEKQKRWREKHRALYNFQQRNRRKNLGSGVTKQDTQLKTDCEDLSTVKPSEGSVPPTQTFITKKVGEFRMLVLAEQEKVIEPVKPAIFRNDFGAIISEGQWKKLEKLKLKAKEGGYVLDEYSQ